VVFPLNRTSYILAYLLSPFVPVDGLEMCLCLFLRCYRAEMMGNDPGFLVEGCFPFALNGICCLKLPFGRNYGGYYLNYKRFRVICLIVNLIFYFGFIMVQIINF